MKYRITAPKTIKTVINLPASKSISNRVLIINALAKSGLSPYNLSDCDDTNVMQKALHENREVVDIMAAGTAMRFLTAYFSISPGTRILTGTERMKQRPIKILVEALNGLGAKIEYMEKEGYPPLRITGTELTTGQLILPGNVSSQYISALLMIAPNLKNGLKIQLTGEIISKPYIDLTLQLMNDFGARAAWGSPCSVTVAPHPYLPLPFTVENDWSAASYWYQIAALTENADIQLNGLFQHSYQGDSKVEEIFRLLGVETRFNSAGIILRKSGAQVERLEYNFIDQPDLAQTLVVTCALKNIPFRFTGLQSLKIKETDRMYALITELGKLGYAIREENNSILYWEGERCVPEESPVIQTYEDHRMAMAFAPSALKLPSITIAEPQVVSKSYPRYWEEIEKAGFTIHKE